MKVVNTLLTIAVIAAASSSAVAEPTGDDLLMAQFGTTDVDPAMTEAFRRAALPVTPELRTKALECWENNGCDTGSGGDLTVAYADGFGENVWRRIVAMEYIQQALTYPEVGKIIYTSARGDAAKSISDLRSYVAQGVDVITLFADHGAAVGPTVQEAMEEGIRVTFHHGTHTLANLAFTIRRLSRTTSACSAKSLCAPCWPLIQTPKT